MKLLKRISELIAANINHLLDQAENPEVMIKQIIRDMEESIIELRRETVRAIARQKHLEKQILAAEGLAKELQEKATLALNNKDEELAKRLVAKKLDNEKKRERLQSELQEAKASVDEIKSDLTKLEDQVQEARRKKEELIRRKRTADAKLQIQKTKGKVSEALDTATRTIFNFNESQKNLAAYEEAISKLESEAEAADELSKFNTQKESELDKQKKDQAIAKELEKLKKAQKKNS
ncbi:MAG: PspA/IM30 family protein [bacterium]